MSLPGVTTLKQAAWKFRKRFNARAIILMYHSVAEVGSDPWGLRVTPAHFAEQLALLREYGRPISLQHFVQAHQAGKIPDRAIVVTFDDGYVDNLQNAKPLLEQYQVPATVFLTSGYIGGQCEFWWDELDRLLLQPGTLPPELHLVINNRAYEWRLGKAAVYGQEDYHRSRSERAWDSRPGSRLAFYYSLWQLLRCLPHEQRQEVLEEIRSWAGVGPEARPTHRPLSFEEARLLGEGEWVELGAHTITHPFLSAYSPDRQRDEIQQGKAQLEHFLPGSLRSFSYPHGDYSRETLNLVEEAGFNCACTVVAESAWLKTDRFQLPRFEVQDWDGEEFGRQLSAWFQG